MPRRRRRVRRGRRGRWRHLNDHRRRGRWWRWWWRSLRRRHGVGAPRFPRGRQRCLAVGRGGTDDRRHHRSVRVTVLQTVAVGDVVAAPQQVRQARMGIDPGVDDRHGDACATAELPCVGEVEHVQVGRLHAVVGAWQGAHPRAVGALLHRFRRGGWTVRWHRAGVDGRRVHGSCDGRGGQCRPEGKQHHRQRASRGAHHGCAAHDRYRIAANTPISQNVSGNGATSSR